jgi:hypothetical protein
MEFCSPSKKQRPDDYVDAGSQRQQQYGWTVQQQQLHQKRKWDAVDEDEEEHEEGEEEQLNDSSDDEDGDDDKKTGKKELRSSSSSSSSTVVVSFPADDISDKPAKHQRVVQKRPDARDIPRARHIILRFSDSGETVPPPSTRSPFTPPPQPSTRP